MYRFLFSLIALTWLVLIFSGQPALAQTEDNSLILPSVIHETEGQFSGTWVLSNGRYNAQWDNGAIAVMTVDSFTPQSVVLHRTDTSNSVSRGMTAVYTGQISSTGESIKNGSVTWTWPGVPGYPATGHWNASWAGCTIALTNASAVRGSKLHLVAKFTPYASFKLSSVQWKFTGGKGGTRTSGKQLFTDITLVDSGQQYTATVTASSTAPGVSCQATANLTVKPRPWKINPKLRPDNEGSWGSLPLANSAGQLLGMERDRVSNSNAIINPSPLVPHQSWEKGYEVARIDDPNGPNDGYYYIKSTRFVIDQETVINKWIKAKGISPAGAPSNWFQTNYRCLTNPAVFVAAVMNHENSGSGHGSTGHFGLIRATEAVIGMDAQTAIEENVRASKADLVAATNIELSLIDNFLQSSAAEQHVSGNWPGTPGVSFWDNTARAYSACNQFKRTF